MVLVTYATLTTCVWIDLWGCRFCCVSIKVLFDFKVLLMTSIPEFPFSKIKFYSPQSTGVILQKFCWNLCVITFSMCKVYCELTGFFGAWKLTRMINRNCEQKVHFCFGSREQMLQILLRITEAVMQKPKENQIKDTFAQSMSGLLFRVSIFCVFGTTFPCP